MRVRFGDDSTAGPIRILVVEGRPLLVPCLAELHAVYPDLQLVGAATSIEEAIPVASALQPDVAIVDRQLSDGDGIELCDQLHLLLPALALIVVSSDLREETLLQAVESGACGVIWKSAPIEDVVEAVLRAADDELLLPGSVALRLFRRERELRCIQSEANRDEPAH